MSMVQCYDEYMQKAVPAPSLLPKQVRIVLRAKAGLAIENALVKVHFTLNDIRPLIEKHFAALGDEITAFDPNLRALVIPPFQGEGEAEEEKKEELLIDGSVSFQSIALQPQS